MAALDACLKCSALGVGSVSAAVGGDRLPPRSRNSGNAPSERS